MFRRVLLNRLREGSPKAARCLVRRNIIIFEEMISFEIRPLQANFSTRLNLRGKLFTK